MVSPKADGPKSVVGEIQRKTRLTGMSKKDTKRNVVMTLEHNGKT
jgi:hypothetical protein